MASSMRVSRRIPTTALSDHGAPLRLAREGVDDKDLSASFAGKAAPRRSSATLADHKQLTFSRVLASGV
jgi:hypothetical protein